MTKKRSYSFKNYSALILEKEVTPTFLEELGNEDIVEIVDEVINCGTEADEQLDVHSNQGMDNLLLFLMENVQYNL